MGRVTMSDCFNEKEKIKPHAGQGNKICQNTKNHNEAEKSKLKENRNSFKDKQTLPMIL